ncbi:uncharacterized protein LOC144295842 [Canis aureus]
MGAARRRVPAAAVQSAGGRQRSASVPDSDGHAHLWRAGWRSASGPRNGSTVPDANVLRGTTENMIGDPVPPHSPVPPSGLPPPTTFYPKGKVSHFNLEDVKKSPTS